ncbi:MAG: hypothetical protein QXL69_01090 [Candidatus Bathyarchaeia archaeon]|nr:hypothetical protein [Candidatus Bathyarchaeota archaeon]
MPRIEKKGNKIIVRKEATDESVKEKIEKLKRKDPEAAEILKFILIKLEKKGG